MNADAPPPFESPAAERRAARLEALAEIGLGLARRLQQDAEEAPSGALDIGAMALAFSRIAKAVRQTIALSARLDAEAAGVRSPAETRPLWDAPKLSRPFVMTTRRDKAASALALAIDVAAGENEAKYERLDDALADELEELDDEAFDDRPIGAIVVEICQALGVEPDLGLWEDEDWAIEEAQVGAADSPYAKRVMREPAGLPPDADDGLERPPAWGGGIAKPRPS